MPYNNNSRSYGNNRNNGNDWNNNNYNSRQQRNERPKKHSGAKVSRIENGQFIDAKCIVAWNVSRKKGMVSLLCMPYKNTKEHKSKSGKVWENWMVKVTFKDQGRTEILSGLYDTETGKVIIKELGWVVNPKAPHGGYCGTFQNK